MSTTRQIPFLILRTAQWPLCRCMPFVLTHLKVVHARASAHAVILAFEEVVEPSKHELVDRTVGDRTNRFEAWTYGAVWAPPSKMLPGADHDALVGPRQLVRTLRAHSSKV